MLNTKIFTGPAILILLFAGFNQVLPPKLEDVRPAEVSSKMVLKAPPPSRVKLVAWVPLAVIRSRIDRLIPAGQSFTTKKHVCKWAIVNVLFGTIKTKIACGDVHVSARFLKVGALGLTGRGNRIDLSLPVALTGSTRIGGALGRIIGRKNLRFAGVASARLQLDIGSDWTPQVKVISTGVTFTQAPQIEILRGVWLKLGEKLGPSIRSSWRDELLKMTATLAKDKSFAGLIKENWHRQVIALPVDGKVAAIAVTPHSIGFSGINIVKGNLQMVLSVAANTTLHSSLEEAKKLNSAPLPLPPLRKIRTQNGPSQVALRLPIRIGYGDLADALRKAAKGQKYEADFIGKKVSMQIENLEIFPTTKERVAIGIRFTADLPGTLGDTTGSLYFVARPLVKDGRLRLAEIELPHSFDNKGSQALADALAPIFSSVISRFGEVNLDQRIKKEVAKLKKSFVAADGLIDLRISNVAFQVENIVPESTSFAIQLNIDARVITTFKGS